MPLKSDGESLTEKTSKQLFGGRCGESDSRRFRRADARGDGNGIRPVGYRSDLTPHSEGSTSKHLRSGFRFQEANEGLDGMLN